VRRRRYGSKLVCIAFQRSAEASAWLSLSEHACENIELSFEMSGLSLQVERVSIESGNSGRCCRRARVSIAVAVASCSGLLALELPRVIKAVRAPRAGLDREVRNLDRGGNGGSGYPNMTVM
jgi:hypothetical protein